MLDHISINSILGIEGTWTVSEGVREAEYKQGWALRENRGKA